MLWLTHNLFAEVKPKSALDIAAMHLGGDFADLKFTRNWLEIKIIPIAVCSAIRTSDVNSSMEKFQK